MKDGEWAGLKDIWKDASSVDRMVDLKEKPFLVLLVYMMVALWADKKV